MVAKVSINNLKSTKDDNDTVEETNEDSVLYGGNNTSSK